VCAAGGRRRGAVAGRGGAFHHAGTALRRSPPHLSSTRLCACVFAIVILLCPAPPQPTFHSLCAGLAHRRADDAAAIAAASVTRTNSKAKFLSINLLNTNLY
jgi:hypothetical protein